MKAFVLLSIICGVLAAPTPPLLLGFMQCGTARPTLGCFQIYQPVCALLIDGTQKTEGNSCTACKNIDAIGYEPGECSTTMDPTPVTDLNPVTDPIPSTTSEKYTMCPQGPRKQACDRTFLETCGFKFTGLPQDYANTCTACADQNVFGFIPGRCSDIVKTCSPMSRLNCQLIRAAFIQSCAFEDGKAPYNVSNDLCCDDSTYEQAITGACPTIQKPATDCPVIRRPNCPRSYLPVCGSSNNGKKQTYSNSCVACADTNVKSYVEGEC